MVMLASLLVSAVPAAGARDQIRAPITARDLAEVADIMGPALSPDGERVVFRVSRPSVSANDTRLDWYVAEVGGGTPVHAGSAGAVRHDGAGSVAEQTPVWDPDSRGFRFLALAEGAVAIWHWRADTGLQREIVDPADIIDFGLSPGGRTLRYTTGASRAEVAAAEENAYEEGVLVDDGVDLGQAVAGGKIEDGRRISQRWNRNWFDRARILWDAPKKETVVDLGGVGAAAAPEVPVPARAGQDQTISLEDGGTASIVANDGARHLTVTRADGSQIQCQAAVCRSPNLAAIAARPGHDMLILFESEAGAREKIWLWRIGDRAARFLTTTDGAERTPIWQPRCAIARAALICAESDPIAPPRLVHIAFSEGRRQTIADPNADLRARIEAVAIPMRWKNGHDGVLLRPAKAKGPSPLVIQYYRCAGFLKGGVGDEIPMLPLVEQGIAVLCINARQPPEGAPMEAGYELALKAIEEAIDDLAARQHIDRAKVGIGGLSFGSSVALWAIRKSKRFAAATISSGQVGAHYYWSNALPGRGFEETFRQFWQAGDPDIDAKRWRILSPAADTKAIDTPLLMQAPESEVRNLVELNTKLRLAGKPAELFAFADEIHIKYQPVHKRAVYERNLDWYRYWLKGDVDPDPAKRAQYVRWQRLRAGQSLQAPAR
ncbi:Atxe2 family lasso peptide isopeptidase [Sphingopyxis sp. R3-92]|uniref:Atxe2 family lasso peptide isopeptidase n=1 Tax=Sphingopyxis sp. R3-92 TaxID=3158553 RepID=UPI003EE4E068